VSSLYKHTRAAHCVSTRLHTVLGLWSRALPDATTRDAADACSSAPRSSMVHTTLLQTRAKTSVCRCAKELYRQLITPASALSGDARHGGSATWTGLGYSAGVAGWRCSTTPASSSHLTSHQPGPCTTCRLAREAATSNMPDFGSLSGIVGPLATSQVARRPLSLQAHLIFS